MENNVVFVSSPDLYTGGDFRILLAGIPDVTMIDILNLFSNIDQETVIHTVTNDDIDWIAKVIDSVDLILLNIDTLNNLVAGYLLAHRKTVWYGNIHYETLNKNKIDNPLTYLIKTQKELV